MPEGNGDPDLCLFGEDVTPNAHALAREFVLLDNFYVNAEVSYDGHAFSTGAYATDFVEKIWPMNYGGRGGEYLSEGGGANRNAYGNVAAPANGYIWDACTRAGVSVRSYGEFVNDPQPEVTRKNPPVLGEFRASAGPYAASVPGLEGKIAPDYPPFDLSIPDNHRIDLWLAEFRRFEKDGNLPRLSILRLGGDHTNYALAGSPTPRAMIAENDLALGPPRRGDLEEPRTGRSPRSSSSRTTRRTAPTTSTATARPRSSSARTLGAASSTRRCTRRAECCGRWS